jgi:Holliday junction resolvasome RuvABC ATP-dependent DNA helicase subunit
MSIDGKDDANQLDLGLPDADGEPVQPSFSDLAEQAKHVFVPSTPINQRNLFAGRLKQLDTLFSTIDTPGAHVIVYGERGVGKTSLVTVAQRIIIGSRGVCARENCHAEDTYATLWTRMLASIKLNVRKKTIGFTGDVVNRVITLADQLPQSPGPNDVVAMLRDLGAQVVFIFDEFDTLKSNSVAQAFAETIKALSDHAVESKIVLVGVGDSVDQLIASHASIERNLFQILMPRMAPEELALIIETAAKTLGMEWEEAAATRVVRLSQGLPHYVHRLGLFATRQALAHESLTVTMDDVRAGMKEAVETNTQSLTDAYLKAIASQRADALFAPVLLACALSRTDELGYFRPYSIKRPLSLMGYKLDVPAFASHLIKFAAEERGPILQKTGSERQWRYRFRNPLMQPFVIMRGIATGDISVETVDAVLSDTTADEPDSES